MANSITSKKQRSSGEPTEEEVMETSLPDTEEKKEIQQLSKTCDEMETSEPEPLAAITLATSSDNNCTGSDKVPNIVPNIDEQHVSTEGEREEGREET